MAEVLGDGRRCVCVDVSAQASVDYYGAATVTEATRAALTGCVHRAVAAAVALAAQPS